MSYSVAKTYRLKSWPSVSFSARVKQSAILHRTVVKTNKKA